MHSCRSFAYRQQPEPRRRRLLRNKMSYNGDENDHYNSTNATTTAAHVNSTSNSTTSFENGNDDGGSSTSFFLNPVALALAPILPALLSIVGSYVIIREVVSDLRLRRRRSSTRYSRRRQSSSQPQNTSVVLLRTLLSLSIADLFFSFAWALSTLPAPADIEVLWGNRGNTATCTAQGFMFQVGFLAEPTFNVLYAVYSLLMVRYQWKEQQMRIIEPGVQVFVWTVTLASAILPIPFGTYNSAGQGCWFNAYPYGCNIPDSGVGECTRGANFELFLYPYVTYVSSCIIAGGVLMLMIYLSVRSLESRVARFAPDMIVQSLRASQTPEPGGRVTTAGNDSHPSSSSYNYNDRIEASAMELSAAFNLDSNSIASGEGTPSGQTANASAVANRSASPSSAAAQPPSTPTTTPTLTATSTRGMNVSATRAVSYRKRSQAVRKHALMYMGAFLGTYFLTVIVYVSLLTIGSVPPALDFVAFILYPFQGMANFIVFSYRRPVMKTFEGRFLRKIICFLPKKLRRPVMKAFKCGIIRKIICFLPKMLRRLTTPVATSNTGNSAEDKSSSSSASNSRSHLRSNHDTNPEAAAATATSTLRRMFNGQHQAGRPDHSQRREQEDNENVGAEDDLTVLEESGGSNNATPLSSSLQQNNDVNGGGEGRTVPPPREGGRDLDSCISNGHKSSHREHSVSFAVGTFPSSDFEKSSSTPR